MGRAQLHRLGAFCGKKDWVSGLELKFRFRVYCLMFQTCISNLHTK
jgi:hypothetical protein